MSADRRLRRPGQRSADAEPSPEEARAQMERMLAGELAIDPEQPGWYRHPVVLYRYRKGELEQALAETDRQHGNGPWRLLFSDDDARRAGLRRAGLVIDPRPQASLEASGDWLVDAPSSGAAPGLVGKALP